MTSKHIEDVVNSLRELARDYEAAQKSSPKDGRIAKRLDALQWAASFIESVDTLREPEGAILTICADNADFGDAPQSAIFVTSDWTQYNEMPFTGDNILHALQIAMELRQKVSVDPRDGKGEDE